ncbi:S1C family serine protease, partial [Chloroflexota bacterium]
TTDRVNTLEKELEGSIADIGTLKNEAGETLSRISSLENEVSSVMGASEVYQRVSQATVRISNGESTIGSGFIFDDESRVVTTHHVIENLTSIYVIFPYGIVSKVTLDGSSALSDVAVLTLQDTPMVEALTLADSDQVNIGRPAVAIGNPFDLPGTMTAGIVSQTSRFVEIESDSQVRWIANLIQFDAPANSGNSGCPLFNSAGEVIGMVIARINPGEGDGIYYAVSSNKIKRVANSIIAKGFFDYPWLGVNIADITPQIVQDMSLETTNGALVVGILNNSPAKASGIEADDIIVAIDGVMIRNIADLTSYLGEHKNPDESATLELIRGATKIELTLEIGSRPS